MPHHGRSALYLKRARDARDRAACASNFMAMDELLDIAAAWRALSAEAERLERANALMTRRARFAPVRLFKPPVPLPAPLPHPDRKKPDAA